MVTQTIVRKELLGDVEVLDSYADLQEEMDSYCEGVQFDGPLPTDLTDPDPNPPGEEAYLYKSDIHDIANYFKR